MKRLSILAATAALFAAATFSFSTVEANGKLDEVLANMQRAAQGIKTLHARMEQVKRNTQIGGREVYKGQIFFKHVAKNNDKVKIDYDVPEGQTVWVVGDQIALYQKTIKQVILTSRSSQASKNQEFAFFSTPYSLSSDQIKSRYDTAYVGDEQVGGSQTAVIELTPKTKSAVRKMKWWVDQSSWLPIKSEVVETSGDVSTFTLSGLSVNKDVLSDGMFEIKYPKDTKVIKR
jgi:outer membrane lipoprotein-sorting protein